MKHTPHLSGYIAMTPASRRPVSHQGLHLGSDVDQISDTQSSLFPQPGYPPGNAHPGGHQYPRLHDVAQSQNSYELTQAPLQFQCPSPTLSIKINRDGMGDTLVPRGGVLRAGPTGPEGACGQLTRPLRDTRG